MSFILTLLVLALVFHISRGLFATRSWPVRSQQGFEGELLQLGNNLACLPDRSHLDPAAVAQTTLVCFPGFVEDMRYFLEVYRDTPARLIIINNANYHNPFANASPQSPDWFRRNPHQLGTIAHDAWCLNQVIENLGGAGRVVVHGHSRGGAVVLEAGQQRPELAGRCEAILEAAVVPRGKLAGRSEGFMQKVGPYLLPMVFSLLRVLPESLRLKSPMMWVSTPYKATLVAAVPFTPKQYSTAAVQAQDIMDWQAATGYDYYDNHSKVTLYVGERDHVLSRSAMLASAAQSSRVAVVETTATDHFVSLERPELIQAYFEPQSP